MSKLKDSNESFFPRRRCWDGAYREPPPARKLRTTVEVSVHSIADAARFDRSDLVHPTGVPSSSATARKRVLLVEDEPGLRMTLTCRLRSEGYDVESVADGDNGFLRGSKESFDLVVLDVMLPGRSGFDVCRDLRRCGVDVPVLMLTARGQVVDKVVGLKLGADDYLTKPFDVAELLARIESCMRRRFAQASDGGPDEYRFGQVHVDFRRAELARDGMAMHVPVKELQLLRYFVKHRGVVLTRDELLDGVWGYDAMLFTRTVDVHVASLRKKIEPKDEGPRYIVTVHGLGYKFVG